MDGRKFSHRIVDYKSATEVGVGPPHKYGTLETRRGLPESYRRIPCPVIPLVVSSSKSTAFPLATHRLRNPKFSVKLDSSFKQDLALTSKDSSTSTLHLKIQKTSRKQPLAGFVGDNPAIDTRKTLGQSQLNHRPINSHMLSLQIIQRQYNLKGKPCIQ